MSRSAPSWLATVPGLVYTLHLWPPYKHAGHYSGWSQAGKFRSRMADHALGRGGRLTQVQLEAGGSWVVADVEPGTRDREAQLKERGASRRCSVCKALKGYQAGKLTAEEALGRAGWGRVSEYERGLLLEIFGIDRAQAGAEKAPHVEPKPFVPRPEPEAAEVTPEIEALVDALEASWSPKARSRKPRPRRNWRRACDPRRR